MIKLTEFHSGEERLYNPRYMVEAVQTPERCEILMHYGTEPYTVHVKEDLDYILSQINWGHR